MGEVVEVGEVEGMGYVDVDVGGLVEVGGDVGDRGVRVGFLGEIVGGVEVEGCGEKEVYGVVVDV